jgi:hypothetical protein
MLDASLGLQLRRGCTLDEPSALPPISPRCAPPRTNSPRSATFSHVSSTPRLTSARCAWLWCTQPRRAVVREVVVADIPEAARPNVSFVTHFADQTRLLTMGRLTRPGGRAPDDDIGPRKSGRPVEAHRSAQVICGPPQP